MSLLEIVEVRLAEPDARLWGRSIDLPRPGSRCRARAVDIAGWVLGRGAPAVGIEVVQDGAVIRRVPLQARPDVATAFPEIRRAAQSGFVATVPIPRGAEELELLVQAAFRDEQRVPIAAIRARPCQVPERPSTLEPLPMSSLIIPSRNRPEFLADLVESILEGYEVPSEIVIVDQSDRPHPTLPTLSTERSCEIRYIKDGGRGCGRARNIGILAARHDILAFCDDDMLAEPDWYDSLVGGIVEAGPRSVVTGRVPPAPAERSGDFAPSTIVDELPVVYEGRIFDDVLFTGNMAMYRSVVERIGLFDERLGPGARFPSSVDNDYGFRLLEAGYRINYVPQAILFHLSWRTKGDHVPLYWRYGLGHGAYFAKHLSLRDRYILRRMLRHLRGHLGGAARQLPGQPRIACGELAYAIGTVFGAVEWMFTQRRAS
jgi:GT2 family glycosyltransferase